MQNRCQVFILHTPTATTMCSKIITLNLSRMKTRSPISDADYRVCERARYSLIMIITMRLIIVFIIMFAAGSLCARADDVINGSWELVKDFKEEDIKIFYRKTESGNIEFRGVTEIKSSLSSFVALVRDTKSMPRWVYRMKRAKTLARISQYERYIYMINSAPLCFKDRDSIVHSTLEQDPNTLSITIRGEAAPDYIDRKDDYERVTSGISFWKFTPLKGGGVKVVFQGHGDPGGSIIASISKSPLFQWLTKTYLWRLPKHTLSSMKREITNEKYQAKKYSFIKEPDI